MTLLRIAAGLWAACAVAVSQVAWTGRVVDQNDTPVAQARVAVRQGTLRPI